MHIFYDTVKDIDRKRQNIKCYLSGINLLIIFVLSLCTVHFMFEKKPTNNIKHILECFISEIILKIPMAA